jgi:hypothetical protein
VKKLDRSFYIRLCAISLTLASFNSARATDLDVTINTTAIDGTSGTLVFDLISGGNSTSNTATISAFSSDGTLGAVTPQGDEIGSLPGTATLDTNSTFFNELAQNITYGTQISFDLNFTQNGPDPTGSPDTFSFFLLNSSGNPIPTTTDPSGGNALFLFNIDGTDTGNLNIYTSLDLPITWQATPIVSSVPEPSVIGLLTIGLMGVKLTARKQRS